MAFRSTTSKLSMIFRKRNQAVLSVGSRHMVTGWNCISRRAFGQKTVMMDSVTWHLSKDSIKKLRCIFEDIDSDSSGRISQDELIQACNKLSIDVENNQLKHFLESDVSGDGELDFHEFCLFYLACLRSIFSEIDVDNSGSIGINELRRAFSKVGFHATEREVLSLLAQVDKDNSETVDFSEFCNFFCSLPAPDFRLIVEKWASGLSVDTGSDLVPPPLPPPSIIVWRAILAGGIAGLVSRTATAPIEKIKILAQTQANGETRLSKVFTTVLQKEGLRGLYAGNGVNCIRVFPFSAIVCLVYANLARKFPLDGDRSTVNSLWRMGAGASAGMIATLLTHPIDVVRARITVQQTRHYKGLFHGIRVIAATENMAGLYRGIGPTLTAIAPFMAVQQVVYDVLKQRSIENSITPTATLFFLCGSAAGAAAQTAVYPLEVIRRRMQLHSTNTVKGQTSLSIFTKLSYRQLFSGLVPTYVKVVPAAAISLLVRDAVLGRLKCQNKAG